MQTKVLKIHYPSLGKNEIGAEAARVRDLVLEMFENNQVSFSFSSNKESGYIMVYPTPPMLSIRISNHESDGSVPVENLVTQTSKGVTINAEADSGEIVTAAMFADMLQKAKQHGLDIKTIIKQYGI